MIRTELHSSGEGRLERDLTRGAQRQLTFDWEDVARATFDPHALFDNPRVEQLLELPEGQYFDRKSAKIEPRGLAETICAFANGDARGGVVAVGIRDKRIEGFAAVGERRLNELIDAPRQFCPLARCREKRIEVDGAQVLLIFVEHSDHRVVEMSDGRVLIRSGDRNRTLAPEDVVRLKQEKGEIPFELEPVEHCSIDDLERQLLHEFAESVRQEDDLEFDRSDEDVLVQKRTGRVRGGRFQPFNVALLLFAKDPLRHFPGCKVRFIRYEGTEERTGQEMNVIKDVVVEAPVPWLIKRAEEAIFSQLRDFQALQPDGRFRTVREYPPDCVREALVNACVHRSYSARNQPVFVRMFDNRLVVESPGGFVPPVTAENIYEQHVPRNPILMDALRYLRFVRCANEGTRRMKYLMDQSGLPAPVFRQEADRLSKVVVTLRNNIEQRKVWIDRDLSRHVGESLAKLLEPNEIRVLNHLAEFHKITVSDAQRITSLKTWHSAKALMLRLVERGIVDHITTKERDPKAHFVLSRPWNLNGSRQS